MKRQSTLALAGLLCGVLTAAPACRRGGDDRPRGAARLVRVAAAADLRFALDDVAAAFAHLQPEITVSASYGSSGEFYAQLVHRAPFDLFLSADVEYPRRLAEQGLAAPGTAFTYAVGRIVVWAPAASLLDVGRLGVNALLDPSVVHVAIANPAHAPYGRAAEAAMKAAGVYDRVQPKLVFGENVAQALQFVQSGAAEVGIVALSLALSPMAKRTGRYGQVPRDTYPPIEQGGAILNWAADPDAAMALRAFVLGPEGRAILTRHGFAGPVE